MTPLLGIACAVLSLKHFSPRSRLSQISHGCAQLCIVLVSDTDQGSSHQIWGAFTFASWLCTQYAVVARKYSHKMLSLQDILLNWDEASCYARCTAIMPHPCGASANAQCDGLAFMCKLCIAQSFNCCNCCQGIWWLAH
eukprot:1388156-Amphidinium_carterae.1